MFFKDYGRESRERNKELTASRDDGGGCWERWHNKEHFNPYVAKCGSAKIPRTRDIKVPKAPIKKPLDLKVLLKNTRTCQISQIFHWSSYTVRPVRQPIREGERTPWRAAASPRRHWRGRDGQCDCGFFLPALAWRARLGRPRRVNPNPRKDLFCLVSHKPFERKNVDNSIQCCHETVRNNKDKDDQFTKKTDIHYSYKMPLLAVSPLVLLLLTTTTIDARQKFSVTPTYREVNPGGSVVLECMVEEMRGECRWEKDGVPVGVYAGKYEMLDSGPGDCSLRVLAASMEYDNGVWQCQVTASDFKQKDTLISDGAQLIVRGEEKNPYDSSSLFVCRSDCNKCLSSYRSTSLKRSQIFFITQLCL